MTNINNSKTSILKATYVPIEVPANPQQAVGVATVKSRYVRQLNLQPGEVNDVQKSLADAAPSNLASNANFWSLLRNFEGAPLTVLLPPPSAFANVMQIDLITFGNTLIDLRQQALQRAQKASKAVAIAAPPVPVDAQALAIQLLNTSVVATNALTQNTNVTPLGMLNLERLEMLPAGIERGGLIATIPLAPKERTAVVQQEWSVTSQEFTSIVTDSLENYSQTGVTENTQLTQSTTSQVSHSNQFNINSSVSGGIGFVTGSVAASFGSQDQSSQSATDSRNHAIQTTRQASARVKQSHKTTISTKTVTGSSESTTRILENPSATDPMRIDYFSLMRKWYVALYRYGLRLTYDIVIPEPGATLRELYMELNALQSKAAQGFSFPLKYSDITLQTYNDTSSALWSYANQWGAQVSPPPDIPAPLTQSATPTVGGGWYAYDMPINVPPGSWITGFDIVMHIKKIQGGSSMMHFAIDGGYYSDSHDPGGLNNDGLYTTENVGAATGRFTLDHNFLYHATGTQTISFYLQDMGYAHIWLQANLDVTPAAIDQWQASVWSTLYNAAQTAFYTNQQNLNAQIQTLQNKINNIDTLTLRREEHDEITKGVLRWLLGPGFDFMPANVRQAFASGASSSSIDWGISFPGGDLFPGTTVSAAVADWAIVSNYEQMVRFINDAIDWDNILYFLYSYFWDIPIAWDNIRTIQHPDSTRQAFLRAGSARVVLTVRKGWELAWTYFVLTGSTVLPSQLPAHQYLTIAQEIQDYDRTNYPGIPPANPNGGGSVDDDTPQVGTTCAQSLQASPSAPVTIKVADTKDFVVGATAIIDTWDSGVQETQTITAVDALHSQISVQALSNAHKCASSRPFPIVQAGAKGLLIAEWFEYTPTSGTDIAITSNLATIA